MPVSSPSSTSATWTIDPIHFARRIAVMLSAEAKVSHAPCCI